MTILNIAQKPIIIEYITDIKYNISNIKKY